MLFLSSLGWKKWCSNCTAKFLSEADLNPTHSCTVSSALSPNCAVQVVCRVGSCRESLEVGGAGKSSMSVVIWTSWLLITTIRTSCRSSASWWYVAHCFCCGDIFFEVSKDPCLLSVCWNSFGLKSSYWKCDLKLTQSKVDKDKLSD